MLTGDKVDTAVNIGFACALWTEEMHLVRVVGENEELDFGGGRWPTKAATEARLHNQLKEAQAQVDNGKEVRPSARTPARLFTAAVPLNAAQLPAAAPPASSPPPPHVSLAVLVAAGVPRR